MARLLIRVSETTARQHSLGPRCVLGRDPRAECVLPSRSVSRHHAVIERRGGVFFIADLGSRNGTFLNGKPLGDRLRLSHRDRIRIGDETLQFFDDESEADLTLPLFSPASAGGNSRAEAPEEAPSRELPPTKPLEAEDERRRLPRQLGKFRVTRLLGRGGMGAVYLAHDSESDRDVAVKFIRPKIGRNESFLDFFHNREAVLARQIDHPNVIRVFEHAVYREQHFIAMEYVPGESLHHLMLSRRLELSEVLEIVRQVACGLYAAHRQGVVHSDIKPANILLCNPSATDSGAAPAALFETPEDDDSILQFDSDPDEAAGGQAGGLDPELLREIQRRRGGIAIDALLTPPFFERGSERRFLEHYLERLAEGRGFVVVVAGERGVGKKTLVEAFLSRRSTQGPADDGSEPDVLSADSLAAQRVLRLDCSSADGIVGLFEKLNGGPRTDWTIRQMAGHIAETLAADGVPVVVHLESFESPYPLAARLVYDLAIHTEARPLLLVASLESERLDRNSALRELLDALKPRVKELFLRPLTEYQIQRYLAQILECTPPGELASDLYRITRGNFAKLVEALRGVVERGLLKIDPYSETLVYKTSAREFELEEGKQLYELFRAYGRIEQQVLETAAFLGPRFFFDILHKLQSLDETSLFFMLRNFVADGFLVEEERTWFRFANAAFQRYLAERTPPHERPQLHRKVGNLLQSPAIPLSAQLCRLHAHHLLGFKDYGGAVERLLETAYRARIVYDTDLVQDAYHEVLRLYRSLPSSDPGRRAVLRALGDWFHRDGNWYEILGRLAAREDRAGVKIADFGISFRVEDHKGLRIDDSPLMGTPRYMAPERSAKNRGGPASDIFALGVIAYEMIVGEPPYPALHGWKVLKAYQRRGVRLPAEVFRKLPIEVEELLRRMLVSDPDQRWDAERVLRAVVQLQFELETARSA